MIRLIMNRKLLIVTLLCGFIFAVFLTLFLHHLGPSTRHYSLIPGTGSFWTRFTSHFGLSSWDVSHIYQRILNNKTFMGESLVSAHVPFLFFWQDADFRHLEKAVTTGGLNITALANFPMNGYAEEWEWQLLSTPEMTDAMLAANETTSRIVFVGQTANFRINDNATIRIDLRDGWGRPLYRGGDDVRVWAINKQKQASLATEVIDLGNGSYWAAIPLLWSGDLEIKVSLAYNRETLRAFHFIRNVVKSTKYMVAGFSSSFGSSATLCSPFPFVPNYENFCSLGEENGGLPWYCGKPSNPALDCHHWTHVADLSFVNPLPLTNAESEWFRWVDKKDNFRLVPTPAKINVASRRPGAFAHIKPKPHCKKHRSAHSWTEEAPRGYLMRNTWVPRSCTMPPLEQTRISECLRDTTVLLLGDSNLRLAFVILSELLDCVIDTGPVKPKWHKPLRCVNATYKLEVRWRTHEFPFHIGSGAWADKSDEKAASEYIDEIPAEGRFVVLVSLYLHFTAHHYSVFKTHVRAVRNAVERLLVRNKNVTVVIRGPHMALQYWPAVYGGDAVGKLFTDIIRAEFRGLYDKVLFIQPWDMTVAAENKDFHPPDYVNKALMKWMLAHICA